MPEKIKQTETEKLREQLNELTVKVDQIEIELKDVQKRITKRTSLGLIRARFQ